MRKFTKTKEELEETKGEQFQKKISNFFIIELNLFLAGYLVSGQAGYPVSGKIIGQISGQISIRSTLNITYVPIVFQYDFDFF